MSEEEQTVAQEADTDATPSVEDQGAQEKSIDELLAEFEGDEPEQQKETVKPDVPNKVQLDDAAKKEIIEQLQAQQKTEQDITKDVEKIKGDLPVEDAYIRWKLEDMASKDQRVLNAFLNRDTKPQAWEAIVNKVASDLQGTYGSQKKTDKEAIASAVHSATEAPDSSGSDVSIKGLSDEEFQMQKVKLLSQAMGG